MIGCKGNDKGSIENEVQKFDSTQCNHIGEQFKAAEDGNIEKLKLLVTKENINDRDTLCATLLIYAAVYGRKEAVSFLINNGADVNASLPDGSNPLLFAAQYGEKDVCALLIKNKADINHTANGFYDRNALQVALYRNQIDVAKLLISSGININHIDNMDIVPSSILALAAWQHENEIIEMLIEKGAKDEWLSNVPGFDPYNVQPITPKVGKDGTTRVGSLPFFLGRGFAHRPWKLPSESNRSHTGYNLFRWADPNKDKGPLGVMAYEDERGNSTKVSIIPTAFVGEKGIIYPKNQFTIDEEGPFVNVVIVDKKGSDIDKIIIRRTNAIPIQLNKQANNNWETTLTNVTDYEPITVEIYTVNKSKPKVVDFDCCYRSAKRGVVIYGI